MVETLTVLFDADVRQTPQQGQIGHDAHQAQRLLRPAFVQTRHGQAAELTNGSGQVADLRLVPGRGVQQLALQAIDICVDA